jgi:hypothetical protein
VPGRRLGLVVEAARHDDIGGGVASISSPIAKPLSGS